MAIEWLNSNITIYFALFQFSFVWYTKIVLQEYLDGDNIIESLHSIVYCLQSIHILLYVCVCVFMFVCVFHLTTG